MDYKELIGKLIFWRDVFLINSMEECKELLSDAATAIETLLAEREAAVIDRTTNADRIRAMSDEELSDFLDKVQDYPCKACCKQPKWLLQE